MTHVLVRDIIKGGLIMSPLTGKEMSKLLKKHGWEKQRQKGSHHHFYKDGIMITVPVHSNKDLKKGMEQVILKEAGLRR